MRILAALAAAVLAGFAASAETRLALVIGNADYPAEVGTLSNTHADALKIASALEAIDFELVDDGVLFDADQSQINRALLKFQRALKAAKAEAADEAEESGTAPEKVIGFIYYSGHGGSHEANGVRANYLIPARELILASDELPALGVSLKSVETALAGVEADAVFLVSDACRNTLPWTQNRGGAQPDRGFTPQSAGSGIFLAHATADGETAPDDGVFATALAEHLTKPNIYAERAFGLAFRKVAQSRTGYTRPTAQNGLKDDFCFVSCPSEKPIDGRTIELAYFQAAETCADFKAYASKYPGGSFIEIAENRIGSLCAAPDTPATPRAADTVDSLTRFLAEMNTEDQNFSTLDALYEVEQTFGLDALKTAADSGNAYAAGILYRAYYMGVFAKQNYAEAFRYTKAACEAGWTLSCTNLGVLYRTGQGVQSDTVKAAEFFSDSCDAGHALACANLASLYVIGAGVERDLEKTISLLEKSCDAGNGQGCSSLGAAYLEGMGVDRDSERGVEMIQQGCDMGNSHACSMYGMLYFEGRSVEQDTQKGVDLLKQGCRTGGALGCHLLGDAYEYGRYDVKADAPEAVRRFFQACEGGISLSCVSLGRMYMDGRGAATDLDAALRAVERAIELGDNSYNATSLKRRIEEKLAPPADEPDTETE